MTTDLGIYRDAVSTANTLIIMEKGNLIEKQQICLDANSAASSSKFLHFKSVLTILALCLCMVMGGEAWGQTVYKYVTTLTSGKKYLIVNSNTSGNNKHALRDNNGAADATVNILAGIPGTGNAVYISTIGNATVWTATASSTNWTFNNNGRYIRASNNSALTISTDASRRVWSYANSNLKNTDKNVYLRYNNGWSCGNKSATIYFFEEMTLPSTTYTVTYNENGGTGTMTDSNSPYASGATVTTLANTFTAPSGKVFNGWNTQANGLGTQYAPSATFTITANTILYAQWVPSCSSCTTITFSDRGYENNTSVDGKQIYICPDISVTFNKNSGTAPAYYISGTAIRAYAYNTFTVTSSSGDITSIIIIFGGSDGSNTITASTGSYSDGSWTGSASSVTFTIGGTSGNRRIAEIVVCTGGGGGGSGCPQIGSSTNTTYEYVPVDNYYKYTYTQMLFTSDELSAGIITSIGFQYAYSTAMSSKTDVKIYMGETTKTSFSSTTDWITSGLTEVYSGDLNCSSGWNDFGLTHPFYYSGNNSLIVVIDDNSYGYDDTYDHNYKFYYSSASGYKYMSYYSDSNNKGNDDISGTTASRRAEYRPNTKFCITPCTPLTGTLSLSSASGSLLVGNTLNLGLGAGILSENIVESGTISYSTSNDLIASVTSAGLVTAVAEGTAYITISFTPNNDDYCPQSVTYTVNVTDGCARIGDGTSNNYYTPVYSSSYNDYYSYTQQIYTASEITAAGGVAGLVETLKFQYYGSSNLTIPLNVYLGQTTQTSLSSAWITDASLRQVFSGSKTFTPGWVEFDISSAGFVWDGTSNILVAVKTNSYADSDYGAYYFYYTDETGGARYYYSSSSEVSLDGNNVATSAGYSTYYRPNVKFCIDACTQPSSGVLSLSSSSSAPLVGSTINLGVGQGILNNTLRDGSGNAITGTYSYTTSSSSIASVTSAGLVTAVAEGSATITVTFTPNGAYSAYCPKSVVYTVNVNDGCPRVGNGTSYSSGYYAPIYSSSSGYYSYTQQIYTASEISAAGGVAGLVETLKFQYYGSSNLTIPLNVYLGQTTQTSLSSAWITDASLRQVFSGSKTFTPGWVEFDISSAGFVWDGESNILIAMKTTGTPSSSYNYFYYTSVSDGARYVYNYSSEVSLDGNNVATSAGYSTDYRPNVKFCIDACTQPSSGILSLSSSSSAPLVGSTINLGVGQGILSNTLRDGSGNAITGTYSYTPSNPSIATVTPAGVVNAVAEGSATITVTFTPNGAYSAYCPKSVVYTVNVNDGCLNMGDESTTASSAPVYGLYKNSYSQMIYSASEIGSAGTITSIAFKAASANTQARDIEIYIGHTTKTSFSSATDFVPYAQLTRVYTASSWTVDADWNTFDITDFEYDGTSNIVVAMYSTATGYSGTSFYAKSVSGSVIYAYSDSNDPNPSTNDGSWDSFSYTSSTSSRPFAKFCITTCTPPTGTFAFTSDVMRIANGATVNLALPANLTNTLSQSGTVTYTSSNPTVASVTNAGLVSASASAHGIAVITATFTPDDDDYCEMTATITIDVACSYSSPVCFDFEDYTASANTQYYADAGLPECWSRIYSGTYAGGEPHGYKGDEAMDGTGIIITSGIYDEYHEDFGYTNYVVMPYISGLAAGDMVSFNAWWQYINYGTLTLGYMTNPADASTFVAIDNATPFLYNFGSAAAGTNLIELPVGLPAGAYLAFKWVCQTNYFSYSVVIDNVCICSAVAGTFELTTTTGDVTAMHTLDISGYVNSTIDTNVTPGEIVYSTSNPDVATVSSEGVIMGLSEGETTITVEFLPDNTAKCPRFATFTISVNDGCTKVGDGGTNTTYYVPVNTYYKYTYSQILYNKTELTAGLITAIGFEYAYSTAMTAKNDVKMYLVETDKTSFSGTTDWVTTVTESNLVYSGTLNCSEGWNTFDLDAPFTYSGTRNLLLVIDDNSGSYNSSSYKFKYTATGSNTVLHYYNDTYNYGNTDIDGQTADGCIANRPNTKFCIFDGALHTITYNTTANCTGGVASSIEPANVVEGQLALLSSEEPTCSTGIFLHWNTSGDDSGTSYAPGSVILVGSSDITLYAIYRICDYVSVSRNGQAAQGIGDGAYDSDGYQKFNACQGSDLSLIATKKDGVVANFTSVMWDVNRHDGNAHLTSDVNTMTYTVENAMGHDILLTVEADDGCQQKIPLRVWVSHGLTMAGDSPTAGEICVGAGKEIYVGDPQVVPQSIIEVDNEAIEIKSTKGEAKRKFIPDGVGECYTSDVVFADFREDVTITDASNIDYVRINLEHSFIADMQISLKCYTPEHEERTAILLQDAYDLSDGGLDNAEYDWPYIYINCFAKYKKYNNPGYSSGECSQGSFVDEVNRSVYVKYDGTTYSATGVRIEASAFDKDLTTAQMLVHLKGMINSGHDPEPFCDGGYYYVFDSWLYNANHYTTDNYASTPTESQWSGRYIASLGFGKPNALDGLDGSEITDIAYNPYGEGLDYCWSNSDSYTYADGDGNILDTDNHKIGYTNGTIVKPSDVDGGTQFYHPYQSFQSLVGCKLNGVWTIQICDSWGLDNGYIFSWEIGLKNVDDNAWSYDVSLVDSHVGTCGGFDPDDRNNSENLISEIDGEPNFYIHPTIANVASLPVTIGATRNCELTLIDNIGCETTGNGFTYTVVQPTVPEITVPSICIGEETTVTADLTTGAVAGPGSSFTWWRTKDGNKTLIDSETGITTSSLSILPTTTDSIYSAEIYDAAGCGGIIDGVVTINVPDDVTDVADYNYIWHGKYINATSSDWNSPTNWILYNSGTSTYTVSSVNIPTIGDNVYIGSAKCGRTNPELTAESFANDLTIASPATLTIPADMTLNIAGDLTNTGTMTANNTSTVVFKGSDDQNISNAQSFGNVTFSQQATGHTINATNGITVNNKATFTQGVLKGNAEFASTATVNDPDNMTYNSFVDGTVTRTTSAAGEFTFPTGSGSVLGTVKASLPASSTIGATFYHSSGTGFDMPDADLCADNNPRLDHVSSHEYWKINTSSSLSSATLKVSSSNPGDHFTIPGATTYEGSHIYGTILQGGCWKTISRTPSEVNGDHNTITISDVNIPAVSMRAGPQPMSLGSTASSTLLPIELTALTATCDGRKALVEWTTASERNNDYFSLEHSDDAINFTEIARIAGAGNSIAPLDYSYTDYGVHGGDNYYRLVQVDYDGTRTASEIVVANCIEASGEPEVLAYPNPFSGDLTVELENFGDRPARIDVYDMLGRLVYTEEVGAPQNSYQTVLHFGNLPDATYTVRVGTADFVINRKVVKQQ